MKNRISEGKVVLTEHFRQTEIEGFKALIGDVDIRVVRLLVDNKRGSK